MFEKEKLELIKYFTKKSFSKGFHIINNDARKNAIYYDLEDVSFIIKPSNLDYSLDEQETIKYFSNKPFTRIMFINDYPVNTYKQVKKLTLDDIEMFTEFLDSCSEEDKEQGQVSLEDYLVYGLFESNKLVAVASLWDWGEVLCDIGILVHPSFRKKGYAFEVCLALMNNSTRSFIWRCDESNQSSYNLAKKIGFQEAGKIKVLENKDGS